MFWICRQEDNNYAANGVGKLSHFFYCTNGREPDNVHLETVRRKGSLKSVSKAQKSPREMLSTNALQVLQHTEMQMWYLQEKVHGCMQSQVQRSLKKMSKLFY